jgi:beta-glucosidase
MARGPPGDLAIQQPVDFLGLNYYTSSEVAFDQRAGYLKARASNLRQPMWGTTEMGWGIYPSGLAAVLQLFKDRYGNPRLYITENGCAALDEAGTDGFVRDFERIAYLRAHLTAAHDAISRAWTSRLLRVDPDG